MSEHLKEARNWLDQVEKHWPDSQKDPIAWYQQRALWRLLLHLEALNPPVETQINMENELALIWAELDRKQNLPPAETQQSEASSHTTGSPTTDSLLGAPAGPIRAATPELRRARGVLTEAELIHVEQCFECWGLLANLRSRLRTHVPAAAGTTSTSVSQASPESVAGSSYAMSPSPASLDPASTSPTEDASREGREKHTKRIHYVVENGAALLVCDNGSKCCSYPAGKYEMDQVLRHVNQVPATEARDER